MIRRQHRKKQIKTNYNNQKQQKEHKNQLNNKNLGTEKEEKQLFGYFKRQIEEILYENNLIRLKKGNLKRKSEPLIRCRRLAKHSETLFSIRWKFLNRIFLE